MKKSIYFAAAKNNANILGLHVKYRKLFKYKFSDLICNLAG